MGITRTSLDELVDAHKRDIDVTLIEGNLRLTVEQRIVQLQQLLEFAEELRRAPRITASR